MQTQLECRRPKTAVPRRGAVRVLVVDDDRDIKVMAEHPRLASIPVIVLSAFDVFESQMDVAAAVHPKPFLVEEVLESVHVLAGRADRRPHRMGRDAQ